MKTGKRHRKSEKLVWKESASKQIKTGYILWKKCWAAWMGRKYNRLSFKRKIVTVTCFMIMTGGYCIFLIASSVRGKPSVNQPVLHISVPQHIRVKVSRSVPDYLSRYIQNERIHRFRMYMDSLYKDPAGRSIYDRIIRERPGLIDSVYRVDNNFLIGQ